MSYNGTAYFHAPRSIQSVLEEDTGNGNPPATKMACTIGPRTRDVPTLEALLRAGMKIARFDFSYGSQDYHQESLNNLKQATITTRRLCAVMLDTMGPEIIVVNRPAEPIYLEAGNTVVLTCDKSKTASSSTLPISYPSLANTTLKAGSPIFVGQYLFTGSETTSAYLTVQQVVGDDVVCICNNSAVLEGLELTVHIAQMNNESPILSAQDIAIIESWGARNSVDFISLSFCRSAQDILDCRKVLDRCGLTKTQIYAKIETQEGLKAYKEIVEAANAVVLSRGNLGIRLDPEKMFLAQKMLLQACNQAGKPVYVTRVVDTMTDAPRPTRAEATDVANLVLDGADGILLGSETFRGKFPVETVSTVLAIARQAEVCFNAPLYYQSLMENLSAYSLHPNLTKAEALASSAVRAAGKLAATLVIVFTVTGNTARLIAKYRPSQPILAVLMEPADPEVGGSVRRHDQYPAAAQAAAQAAAGQPEVIVPRLTTSGLKWQWTGEQESRQCLQYRGVIPMCADPTWGREDGAILDQAFLFASHAGLIKSGDKVVVSMCPRQSQHEVMAEAGVVKFFQVEEDSRPSGRLTLGASNSMRSLPGSDEGMEQV